MEKQSKIQKVFDFRLKNIQEPYTDENICKIMAKGYEITDIEPYFTASGGAIFIADYGVYVDNVLITLTPSNKKSKFFACTIRRKMEHEKKINEVIHEASKDGARLIKIISRNGFVDSETGCNIGKGTYFFTLFFVKDI